MKKLYIKHKNTYIFIVVIMFLFYARPMFAQEDASIKNAHRGLLAFTTITLSTGLTLQIAGIALLSFSQSYYFKNIPHLENSNSQNPRLLDQNKRIYNDYFITSISLISAGTVSTVTGIILAMIHQAPRSLEKSNRKEAPLIKNLQSKTSTLLHPSLYIRENMQLSMHLALPFRLEFSMQ